MNNLARFLFFLLHRSTDFVLKLKVYTRSSGWKIYRFWNLEKKFFRHTVGANDANVHVSRGFSLSMWDDTYDRVINPFPRNRERMGKKKTDFFPVFGLLRNHVWWFFLVQVFFHSLHFSNSTSIHSSFVLLILLILLLLKKIIQ